MSNLDLLKLPVYLVAAMDKERVIGLHGGLPWPRNPTDLNRFKGFTLGQAVVYGHATLRSFPRGPLPDRTNILLTSNPNYEVPAGVLLANTPYQACLLAVESGAQQLWVAGGQRIFETFLPSADGFELTIFDKYVEGGGDRFFPAWNRDEWDQVGDERFHDEKSDWGGMFQSYARKVPRPLVTEPRNARSQSYLADLVALNTLGECPFCPGGKTHQTQGIIFENEAWWVTHNTHPLTHSELSLVLVPKRHVIFAHELHADEVAYERLMLQEIEKMFGLEGWARTVCEGEPMRTGATVRHLHYQLLVPEPGKAVQKFFGPFPVEQRQ
jgi:dihydrofolate reductase